MIHFLLAAGICPNNGQNPTWSLLREKFGSDWDDYIKRQLKAKCTIPDISEYDNRPMYPHEISLSLLDFAFLSESLGIKSRVGQAKSFRRFRFFPLPLPATAMIFCCRSATISCCRQGKVLPMTEKYVAGNFRQLAFRCRQRKKATFRQKPHEFPAKLLNFAGKWAKLCLFLLFVGVIDPAR